MAQEQVVLYNFINGEFVTPKEYIDSYDPSVGEVYAKIPDSDSDDVCQAVKAAKEAFKKWVTCNDISLSNMIESPIVLKFVKSTFVSI